MGWPRRMRCNRSSCVRLPSTLRSQLLASYLSRCSNFFQHFDLNDIGFRRSLGGDTKKNLVHTLLELSPG